MSDRDLMARALLLAERGRGRTSPNPMVGAVVVTPDGVVVGSGYHEVAGGPHAEVVALAAAGARAQGATLYCTLEPCCHVGRTGPCTERILEAGISRVVAAVRDPNPRVAGGGFARLRGQGVTVEEGLLAREAAELNAPFFTWIATGRPFVIAKIAVSLDGTIASGGGAPARLTSAAANRAIHLDRAAVDAIGAGSGTILADDPLLTARGAWRPRPLLRVIFDRSLRTPPSARVFSTPDAGPVIIMSTAADISAHLDRARALQTAGAEIEALPDGGLTDALQRLGTRGITSLLLEGGPRLHRAAWTAGLVDVLQLYVTPRSLPAGMPWLSAQELSLWDLDADVRTCGPDVRIEGYVYRAH